MQSLLARATAADVVADPYPHIALTDALDPELSDQLLSEFPSTETIAEGADVGSNKRFSLPAARTLESPDVSDAWKEFIRVHTSPEFGADLMRVFGEHIRREHQSFVEGVGGVDAVRWGQRYLTGFEDADVLLEAQPSINTPVLDAPTSVRRAHLDRPETLFAGLFYLRRPDDESTGGDLEIYRFKKGTPHAFAGPYVDEHFLEVVDTVRYERNTLVLFLNTLRSLHGVTVRSQTPATRCFVNLVAEVEQPLFDVTPHQRTLLERLAIAPTKARQVLTRA